jgi:signal transduction histidine kinase/ligand-binding sensor domain-containing protein
MPAAPFLRRSRWFAVLFFIALRLPAAMPEPQPQEEAPFVFRTWKTEDGLPNNSVTAIAQTPDGFLWLGTYNGLARFDGVNFHALGLRDGLHSLQISALLLDHHGALWIGTVGGGLSRLEHGIIKTWTTADGLAANSVNELLEDQDGVIWISTVRGLSRWKDGAFITNTTPALANQNIGALALDRTGGVWIAAYGERLLVHAQSGHFDLVQMPQEVGLIHALLVDEQSRLWVGANSGKIFLRDNAGKSWRTFGQSEGLPAAMINTLAMLPDGAIWAGTLDAGIYYLHEGRFISFSESKGLPSNGIYSLFVDRAHFLWVGTRAGGLCRLTPRHVYNLRVMEDGNERFPNSLAETADENLWVSTPGRGLFRWDGSQFQQFLRAPPISGHRFVRAVLAGHDGSLWWGAGPALFQWKDDHLVQKFDVDNAPWLQRDRVTALREDITNGLWVATYNGQLRHLQNGTFTPIGKFGGQPITDIAQQPDGTLWVGTFGGGLMQIKDGKQTDFTVGRGELPTDLIRALHLDGDEVLWIGTAGGGLGRCENGKFDFFGKAQGLIDENILQIQEDDDGNLWLGCDHGLMRVNKAGLERIAHHQSPYLHPLVFGIREGMLSEQCVIAFHGSLKSKSGRLYFSTPRGIVIVDPRQHAALSSPPTVVLEKIFVNGMDETAQFSQATPLPLDQPFSADPPPAAPKFGPGAASVKFVFTGLNYDAPERIQFRYRLDGVDNGWVDSGKDRTATYAHLIPGSYAFHVIACNAQGLWNETGAAVRFNIRPHLWQRGWFIALEFASGTILFAGLIGITVRRRYRNRLRRLETERATENERARIARDLHDEVGSSLTRISMLSEQVQSRLNDPEQLKVRTDKLSDFAVRATQAFEEIVWAVNPRNDSLRSLLEYLTHFANELFEDTGIICRFQIPNDLPDVTLPPDTRHSLFLAIKEALNNALKHSGAAHVILRVDLTQELFQVEVQDDGRGFILTPSAPESSEHNGLPNMRQRIENLGGQFSIQTRPGGGTVVRIRLAREKLALHKSGPGR